MNLVEHLVQPPDLLGNRQRDDVPCPRGSESKWPPWVYSLDCPGQSPNPSGP